MMGKNRRESEREKKERESVVGKWSGEKKKANRFNFRHGMTLIFSGVENQIENRLKK